MDSEPNAGNDPRERQDESADEKSGDAEAVSTPAVDWGDLNAVQRDILTTIGRLHPDHDHIHGMTVVRAIDPVWKGRRIYDVLDQLDEYGLIDKRIRVPDGAHNSYVVLPAGYRLLNQQQQALHEIVDELSEELASTDTTMPTGAKP